MERCGPVIVAAIEAIEVVAEGRVHARVNAQIDIKHWIHVRRRQYAGMLEWNAEIENVGVRVKRIVRRVDDFRSFEGHILSDFYVYAGGSKPWQMEQRVRFDDIELIAFADRLVELTQEVRIARVRTVHRLELEAEIVSGCLRIEGALHR